MGTPIDEAVRVLGQTESRLRELISKSASEGQYLAVKQLTTAAERLTEVGKYLQGEIRVSAPAAKVEAGARAVETREARSTRAAKSGYPRYERHGETMWRIGWSKKSKSEYVHKVPRGVFDRIVDALSRLAKVNGVPVTAEDIISELDAVEGADTPSYQVYATLGALGQKGRITKTGRDGYSIPDAQGFESQAWQVWEGLDNRR